MTHDFRLPDVGEGLTEAEVVAWHVEPGDTVTEDQIVAEVETDKAVVEVPAPVDGTVAELHAAPGEVVAVGDVLISFEVADGAATTDEPQPTEDEPQAAEDESEEDHPPATTGRVFAAPSTRRLARDAGVDLAAIDGSGPGGRVTTADVRAAAADTDPEPVRPEQSRTDTAEQTSETEPEGPGTRERTLATPAVRRLARELDVDIDAVPSAEERDGEAVVTAEAVEAFAETDTASTSAPAGGEDAETIPYRGVRRAVGEQMERSAYTAPHVTHHDHVDVTELVEIRERLKPAAEERGVHLTYLPFVIKAVIAGLREYPLLNASLDAAAEEIHLKQSYNIGIATATDAGLMVPVVADADQRSLLELATEIDRLTERARDRSIDRAEMQNGTFTITNFGAIGGEYATPIINYPEVAILGLGAIAERPLVVDGSVAPRQVLTLSLSIDHRVVDGAVAARFVNAVKRSLADPAMLLLE